MPADQTVRCYILDIEANEEEMDKKDNLAVIGNGADSSTLGNISP